MVTVYYHLLVHFQNAYSIHDQDLTKAKSKALRSPIRMARVQLLGTSLQPLCVCKLEADTGSWSRKKNETRPSVWDQGILVHNSIFHSLKDIKWGIQCLKEAGCLQCTCVLCYILYSGKEICF